MGKHKLNAIKKTNYRSTDENNCQQKINMNLVNNNAFELSNFNKTQLKYNVQKMSIQKHNN